MDKFEEAIKDYLDRRAAEDREFADMYNAEGKSIKGCCEYIIGEVQKSGRCGFSDEEVYGMAVHYYCESDLEEVSATASVKVVVNHTIELEESEREELRERARREFLNAERKKLAEEEEKKREKAKKALEKRREEEKEMENADLLFSFE